MDKPVFSSVIGYGFTFDCPAAASALHYLSRSAAQNAPATHTYRQSGNIDSITFITGYADVIESQFLHGELCPNSPAVYVAALEANFECFHAAKRKKKTKKTLPSVAPNHFGKYASHTSCPDASLVEAGCSEIRRSRSRLSS